MLRRGGRTVSTRGRPKRAKKRTPRSRRRLRLALADRARRSRRLSLLPAARDLLRDAERPGRPTCGGGDASHRQGEPRAAPDRTRRASRRRNARRGASATCFPGSNSSSSRAFRSGGACSAQVLTGTSDARPARLRGFRKTEEMNDEEIVARQLGRTPRALRRVVVRCPYGRPAVTEQDPYDAGGAPFPTTYYLTCPHLVAAIARVEAAGGVERWSRSVAEDADLRASLVRATEEQRRRSTRARRRPRAGRTRARRSTSGSVARARRSASSACTRTRRSPSPGPGTCSATGSSTRSTRCGLSIAAVREDI